MHKERQQGRFVEWDWDYTVVDQQRWRIEDVRKAVRKRVAELFWEAQRRAAAQCDVGRR